MIYDFEYGKQNAGQLVLTAAKLGRVKATHTLKRVGRGIKRKPSASSAASDCSTISTRVRRHNLSMFAASRIGKVFYGQLDVEPATT